MATPTPLGLRDRMTPPAVRRTAPRPGRKTEVDRLLRVATGLFGVSAAGLVLAGPDGLAVAATSGAEGWDAGAAVDAARRLFEALAAASAPAAGVMEEVAPARGFLAATPVIAASGRCLGAICLADAGRRTLMTGLQRRLFGAFGELVAPALGGGAAPDAAVNAAAAPAEVARLRDSAIRLQDLADRDGDALALFDRDGRCLLRNRRFAALLGTASAPAASPPAIPSAEGCEESWLARHLARDVEPVGVYRASLADGTWLSVEERRSPHGRSLVARVEERDAFGGSGDMQLLFERCPLPMFVFDRDTRAILAVNAAALALYGWERDAFLRLDLDGLGPVGAEAPQAGREGADACQAWTHRTRDGRPLPVSGRTVGVDHRGRRAVLVTVTAGGDALEGRERAA